MEIVTTSLIANFPSVSFSLIRKCYTIGPFVPPFTGERHGDSVGELLWKLLEEVPFSIWVGRGPAPRGAKLLHCSIQQI